MMIGYNEYTEMMRQLGLSERCKELEKEIVNLKKEIDNNTLTFRNIVKDRPEFIRIPVEVKLPIPPSSDVVPIFAPSAIEYRLMTGNFLSMSRCEQGE